MECRVLDSLSEIRGFRSGWEELRANFGAPIFSSIDIVTLWLEDYRNVPRPQMVVA